MVLKMSEIVTQFKREWPKYLLPESIKELCKEINLDWRDRKLDPATTVHLMMLQLLEGDTAISHLPHLSGKRFSPSAFCKARLRLPLELFEKLTKRIAESFQQNDFNQERWFGHRVFIVDGTGVSMPEDPRLVKEFGYPRKRKDLSGFPVARLVLKMHFGTGLISSVLINPFRSSESRECYRLHPELKEDDIFLADRGYCSYAHISRLLKLGAHAVLRLHQKMAVDFTPDRKDLRLGQISSKLVQILGKKDQIVDWTKGGKLQWMSKEDHEELPDSIRVREIQYKVTVKGFRTSIITIVTTLLDNKKYSLKNIADLYLKRWNIETNILYFKTFLKMDVLKTKTPENIKKQILLFCVLYNLVRMVMLEAARRQKVKPNRISFVDALRWLMEFDGANKLGQLIVLPVRLGRSKPRIKKRHDRGYQFRFKTLREKKAEWKQQCRGLS